MKTFDEEPVKEKPVYKAQDVWGDSLEVGDIVIGAIGSKEGYIFKGTILSIHNDNMIKVRQIWTSHYWRDEWKVDAKRVRGMKYEKI